MSASPRASSSTDGSAINRDGFAEMVADDQRRMAKRAIKFEDVKKAASYAGKRPERFTLLPAGAKVPTGAKAKTIYLVRHGEGVHNAWRAAEQAAGRTPTAKRHNVGKFPNILHDPVLTAKGLADAAAAAAVARGLQRPELLVTSPMRRAVQTLLTVFKDALAAGVPAVAHELCREAFHGTDPSIYDSRLSREVLAATFPQVDFHSHVLAPELAAADGSAQGVDDPLWWHCVSPFGAAAAGGEDSSGIDEAAIAEHAYRFLTWLMARPEPVVAVATHCNFLLALYHSCLDGAPGSAQVFHTGELRAVTVVAVHASPTSVRAHLGAGAS